MRVLGRRGGLLVIDLVVAVAFRLEGGLLERWCEAGLKMIYRCLSHFFLNVHWRVWCSVEVLC